MKVNVQIATLILQGSHFVPTKDISVDTIIKVNALLHESDAHQGNLVFVTQEQGNTGYTGSSISYGGVIQVFAHHKNRYYWKALYGGLTKLTSNQSRVLITVSTWEDADVDALCEDIQYALRSLEQDSKDANNPHEINLIMLVKETEKELLERLQEIFAPAS